MLGVRTTPPRLCAGLCANSAERSRAQAPLTEMRLAVSASAETRKHTWRIRTELSESEWERNGVQGVAGSNPAVPNAQKGMASKHLAC